MGIIVGIAVNLIFILYTSARPDVAKEEIVVRHGSSNKPEPPQKHLNNSKIFFNRYSIKKFCSFARRNPSVTREPNT